MAVACFTYGWGRWCACLFLGACPVGAWEQWRWRVLRAGSVGLLLRRRILVEVRTLLCGVYSGCGWAPPYLCVWSGHLAAGRFLCTAPGPVAALAYILCVPGFSVGRFLRAVVGCSRYGWADNSVGVVVCCVRRFLRTAGGPVAWRILRTAAVCCVERIPGTAGAWRRGAFCVRLWVYPVCYEVDSSTLFNFNRIFPPFPGACRNLARKPLFFGYNAYAVGLMFGVRGP